MKASLHFLDVGSGDCSVFIHESERVTVVDVCNARRGTTLFEDFIGVDPKDKPNPSFTNPVSYLGARNIDKVFRFILTHPDMDHMDGIKDLFEEFSVGNFWDVKNGKKMSGDWGIYREKDWARYQELRRSKRNPKVLFLDDESLGPLYNKDGTDGSGDQIFVLAPSKELISEINSSEDPDYNDLSYVLLFFCGGRRIVFAGDSHDISWNSILESQFCKLGLLDNIDVLIAPHHGRDSGRDYSFLDILRPKMSLIGRAPSEHINYGAWSGRGLPKLTNNSCKNIRIDFEDDRMDFYISSSEEAASGRYPACKQDQDDNEYFYIGSIR
jgi:beta-lactamase superfamily II metal-dependent hydrolase